MIERAIGRRAKISDVGKVGNEIKEHNGKVRETENIGSGVKEHRFCCDFAKAYHEKFRTKKEETVVSTSSECC